ncbi:hypothetical protein H0H87_006853 [Tephrocybe sp. NHM501043]|nr:hypothetical protein H0H87_006853 [Tephrocybe sp. NHM501043]
MVFSQLQNHEKEAFFSLLDEYFASRPEVFRNLSASSEGAGSSASAGASAASAVHHALASNPEATSRLVSAGLKHGVPKSSPYSAAASDPEVGNVAGRVAAASLAFSARNNAPPQRTAPPIAQKPAGASGLILDSLGSTQKIGDFDTSSKGAMIGSLYTPNKNKNPPPAAPPPPAAFPSKKNSFAAPPTRRSTSDAPSLPPRQPEPEPEPEPEEEYAGEWALALYDYNSGVSEILPLEGPFS